MGGSVASLFGATAQALTGEAARDMAGLGARKARAVAVVNTPVKTGRLRAGWYVTDVVRSGSDAGAPVYSADVANDVEYSGYVEDGTGLYGPKHAPYLITPRDPSGVLRWIGPDGRVVFAKYVLHPGSPGQHMLKIGMNVVEATLGGIVAGRLEEWARAVEEQADKQF